MTTFIAITRAKIQAKRVGPALIVNSLIPPLKYIIYIYHQLCFKKDQAKVHPLSDSGSEVNAMTLVYIIKLSLKVCCTDIRTQKIDSFILKMFKMVLASFQVKNKLEKAQFFQKTFFILNTRMAEILNMIFLIVSNANVLFAKKELT